MTEFLSVAGVSVRMSGKLGGESLAAVLCRFFSRPSGETGERGAMTKFKIWFTVW